MFRFVTALFIYILSLNFHPLHAQIVINEVDADQAGSDGAEFVELFGTPNQSLDGLVLVLFNGSTDLSYNAFDLDGHQLNGDGYFVLCGNDTNVANCDLVVSPAVDLLADGADAVALFTADATDFPNGTPVTNTNLIDALVYDTDDADDPELLATLTPGQNQIDEDADGDKDNHANARYPDGGSVLDTSSYIQQLSTPGVTNGGTVGSAVMINEFVANHTGTDTHEFFEIFGLANTDYSNLTIVQLEGDSGDGPGTLVNFFPVGTTDADGFFFDGFLNNIIGGGSKTLLLVRNFSGFAGTDLDPGDDGTLDTNPWDLIVDAVAVNDGGAGDQTYAGPVLDSAFGGGFAPGGASRIPNGSDTDTVDDWLPNDFDGAGLPGFPGTLANGEAYNTPGLLNSTEAPPSVVINEFLADHVGGDTNEYLEVYGSANTNFGNWWLLQIDGRSAGNPGLVHRAIMLGTTSSTGYWYTGFMIDQLVEDAFTLLLVEEFSGSEGSDLDTNNDGTLDTTPWTSLRDEVAVNNGDSGNLVYSMVVLGPDFGGLPGTPGGASRIPNGTDTDEAADWVRNDFDGEGLSGFTGSLETGEAVNTPGAYNTITMAGSSDALINEVVADHTGDDTHEYVEIFGSPSSSYAHLWIVQLEGDSETGAGVIDTQYQVGETDVDGYWYTQFLLNELGNGSKTLLLVDGYSGTPGSDLDTNDDGTLDITPWTNILDSVAISDGGLTDRAYSETVMLPNFDGIIFTPGGVSRIPNGTDTDTPADWVRNDFSGAGLPGFTGDLGAGEALNTPGIENSDEPLPGANVLISEFVADHEGADTFEFVELFGDPGSSYSNISILIINGNSESNPGHIDAVITGGSTDSDGFWASAYQSDVLVNGTLTLLAVDGFSGSVGDDLDSNDDGTLNTSPWANLHDSVAVSDGGAADHTYSTTVLSSTRRSGSFPGGASRFPYYGDTDSASDWHPNDFQGEGLPGQMGDVSSGEAFNTPGRVNVVPAIDYYAGVSSENLRGDVHDIIANHVYFPYTSSFTDTWDVLETADQDPLITGNILSVYKNASYAKVGGGNSSYNREHTWPKSFGFPDDNASAMPYTDTHHLMLADGVYNSTRNNLAFGDCTGCSEAPTNAYNGQGGGTGIYPGNSNWYQGSGGTGSFEVWHYRRGEVARAQFYMAVRYEGGTHAVTGAPEPDLILTDDTSLINTFSSNTTGAAYMGRLSTLLQWHLDDPVDDVERARNEIIYRFQGNRNPFVDHPEWVSCIFENDCDGALEPCTISHFPEWTGSQPLCGSGTTQTILDYIAQINGSCSCN